MMCRQKTAWFSRFLSDIKEQVRGFHLTGREILLMLLGSGILAFGLYQVHAQTRVTEGGVLGLTLLLQYWFGISPAYTNFILDVLCYGLGCVVLGAGFLLRSLVCSASFSVFYWIFEHFTPLWPDLYARPLAAALAGAAFVGIGVGLCVRVGAAPGGDDALAMSINKLTRLSIAGAYLFTDMAVLLLSLSYIPLTRIVYSLITVILSGRIIDIVARTGCKTGKKEI